MTHIPDCRENHDGPCKPTTVTAFIAALTQLTRAPRIPAPRRPTP